MDINIYEDKWLEKPPSFAPTMRSNLAPMDFKVADIINPLTRQWNLDVVNGLLDEDGCSFIEYICLARTSCKDRTIWYANFDGVLTAKLAYSLARKSNGFDVNFASKDIC